MIFLQAHLVKPVNIDAALSRDEFYKVKVGVVTSCNANQHCEGGLDKLNDRMKSMEDSLRHLSNEVEHLKRLHKQKSQKEIENTLFE